MNTLQTIIIITIVLSLGILLFALHNCNRSNKRLKIALKNMMTLSAKYQNRMIQGENLIYQIMLIGKEQAEPTIELGKEMIAFLKDMEIKEKDIFEFTE